MQIADKVKFHVQISSSNARVRYIGRNVYLENVLVSVWQSFSGVILTINAWTASQVPDAVSSVFQHKLCSGWNSFVCVCGTSQANTHVYTCFGSAREASLSLIVLINPMI